MDIKLYVNTVVPASLLFHFYNCYYLRRMDIYDKIITVGLTFSLVTLFYKVNFVLTKDIRSIYPDPFKRS